MVEILKPPNMLPRKISLRPSVFLAGSIEMGKAVDWQNQIQNEAIERNVEVTFYNPRRDEWDESWEQKITNPKFNEQVTWELDHIGLSDLVFMYFAPGTQSPISLLELGIVAGNPNTSHKLVVCCPEGFWRKGNVDIVCQRAGIPVYTSLEEATWIMLTTVKMLNGAAKSILGQTGSGGPR